MTRAMGVLSFAVACLAPAIGSGAAEAVDYEREARWAQEVVPAIVVGDAVYLATGTRPRVLAILTSPPGTAKGAAVIVHGLGLNPDWGVIGALRTQLADDGYVTLSVQMPVLAADAPREAYDRTMPEAAERIAAAIAYLKAGGAAKIAIVSHSLGASMANAYLARTAHAPIDAWIPIGMSGAFAAPPEEPVLDVVAERELPQVGASASARAKELPRNACSRAVTIAGADHYFESRQKELSKVIAAFLDRVFGGRCQMGS